MILDAVTDAATRFGAPAFLVGGAVRDRLRGVGPVDLDVSVEGDGVAFARLLATDPGWRCVVHEAFGTAVLATPAGVVDVVTARREAYPVAAGLPVVSPSTIADDLARRDFTINAVASPLAGPAAGTLLDPFGGAEDIAAGVIRVLHDASFVDDPTRIIRAARYAARLGFRVDPHTAELARAAAPGLRALSVDRLHDALALALAEPAAAASLEVLDSLGALAVLGLRAATEAIAIADAIAAEVAPDAEPWRYRLALAGGDAGVAASDPAARVARAATRPEERAAIVRFLGHDRHVRTELDGVDVMRELGLEPGPRVGAVLAELLARKVAGELPDRDAELAALRGRLAAP